MQKLILISFDAVGSEDISLLERLPNFQGLIKNGKVFRDVESVFVTNTYPVHTSIATGKFPMEHGIISNTHIDPIEKGRWCCDSRYIQKKTLWQAAKEKGLKTASVLWPVTGHAKEINWNIPEIVIREGENQVVENLKAGSILTQLGAAIRHKHLMKGITQPNLDTFATNAMCDIIRKKKPDLMLLHLTSFDAICHKHGRYAEKTQSMLSYLDTFLGMILNVLESDTSVIVFSDHAQLDVHTNIDLNAMLAKKGYLTQITEFDSLFKKEKNIISDYRCFFHNAGGSAFFFEKQGREEGLSKKEHLEIQKTVLTMEGVERLLTAQEMEESGFGDTSALSLQGAIFGVGAKEGWYFEETNSAKATHGYTLNQKNYKMFCALNQAACTVLATEGEIKNVLDITKMAVAVLNIKM